MCIYKSIKNVHYKLNLPYFSQLNLSNAKKLYYIAVYHAFLEVNTVLKLKVIEKKCAN